MGGESLRQFCADQTALLATTLLDLFTYRANVVLMGVTCGGGRPELALRANAPCKRFFIFVALALALNTVFSLHWTPVHGYISQELVICHSLLAEPLIRLPDYVELVQNVVDKIPVEYIWCAMVVSLRGAWKKYVYGVLQAIKQNARKKRKNLKSPPNVVLGPRIQRHAQ